MSESLPVVKKRSPLKIIALIVGLLVVLSVAGYLVFTFKSNLEGLLSKGSEEPIVLLDERGNTSEAKSPFDTSENQALEEEVQTPNFFPLDLLDECISSYSSAESRTPFYEEAGSALGLITGVDQDSSTITIQNKDFYLGNVTEIFLGQVDRVSNISNRVSLPYTAEQITKILDIDDFITVFLRDDVVDKIIVYCYAEN